MSDRQSACSNSDELLKLAASADVRLIEERLDAISRGVSAALPTSAPMAAARNPLKMIWKEDRDMRKELLEGLTEEQIEKVKACENVEDLLQLAKDEDVKLNEEQLDAINGGGCGNSTNGGERRKRES